MKKYGLRILVGLIAFAIGVGVVIRNLEPIIYDYVLIETEQSKLENPNLIKSGKIEFIFKGFGEDSSHIDFVLINGSDEDIYYSGYGEGSYCTVDYKQKGKIKMSPACCGTGLGKQTLKAGKQQVFSVWLFDWKDVSQVGFNVLDKHNNRHVVWSNKVK